MLIFYTIKFYDKFAENTATEQGITSGETFLTAMKKINDYYNDNEQIISFTAECLEDIITVEELKDLFSTDSNP